VFYISVFKDMGGYPCHFANVRNMGDISSIKKSWQRRFCGLLWL